MDWPSDYQRGVRDERDRLAAETAAMKARLQHEHVCAQTSHYVQDLEAERERIMREVVGPLVVALEENSLVLFGAQDYLEDGHPMLRRLVKRRELNATLLAAARQAMEKR